MHLRPYFKECENFQKGNFFLGHPVFPKSKKSKKKPDIFLFRFFFQSLNKKLSIVKK